MGRAQAKLLPPESPVGAAPATSRAVLHRTLFSWKRLGLRSLDLADGLAGYRPCCHPKVPARLQPGAGRRGGGQGSSRFDLWPHL